MGRIKLSIHPLFLLFAGYYLLTNRILEFVISTIVAVIHELGHSFVALSRGYVLNKIVLMPYGAVVKGNIKGLKFIDQAEIALAGPLLNLGVTIFFVSLWWFFPEIYAYTDIVAFSSLSMAVVNLIPAYPLDGGRVLTSLISLKFGEKVGVKTSKIIGLVLGVALIGLFVWTAIDVANYSILLFAIFVIVGSLNMERENEYVKMYSVLKKDNLKRGVNYHLFAVEKQTTIRNLIRLVDSRSVNCAVVFDNGEKVAILYQKQLERLLLTASIYDKIGEHL